MARLKTLAELLAALRATNWWDQTPDEHHHLQATPVTREEWNELWNGLGALANRLGETSADIRDAILMHIEGIAETPQFIAELTEGLEGRHGFEVTRATHKALYYVRNAGWVPLRFVGGAGVPARTPALDMQITDMSKEINSDYYASDAHVVRIIYEMIVSIIQRVDAAELRIISDGERLTIVEERLDNVQSILTDSQGRLTTIHGQITDIEEELDAKLTTQAEKAWVGFMDWIVFFVQPTMPTQADLDPWVNRHQLTYTLWATRQWRYRAAAAVWIDTRWIKGSADYVF